MIRIRRDDFDDPVIVAAMAAAAGLSIAQFTEQFHYVVEMEPPPLVL
jgi:AraC-like DNA-binding protein